MDDKTKGDLAQRVLDNEAFRLICEETQDGLRKAFLGDDEQKAMDARHDVRALERVLSKLTRWSQRGNAVRKREREEQERRERLESEGV